MGLIVRIDRWVGEPPVETIHYSPGMDVPTDLVAFVQVIEPSTGWRIRLIGADHYWVDVAAEKCGQWHDDADEFGPGIAFDWSGDEIVTVFDGAPTDDALVLDGVLVPDDDWDEIR